jgi:hypothetical protein
MTRPVGDENEVRRDLLKLIHRATLHYQLRTPDEVALLAEAYANVVHPERLARGDRTGKR